METLAFIHLSIAYEDPSPEAEITLLREGLPQQVTGGLAGLAIATAMLAGTAPDATAATASLARGSQGEEVKALQTALGIEADGKNGAQTEAAVTDFQIRQGLAKVNGVAERETTKALGLDENYRPVGYVVTNSGIGLNIRRGPGLGYRILGAVPDGYYLDTDWESVVYNNGYRWVEVTDPYSGRSGWSASRFIDGYYHPVSGYDDCDRSVSYDYDYDDCYRPSAYYYDDCYRSVSYDDDDCYRPSYRRVSYYSYRPRAYYYDDCGRYY